MIASFQFLASIIAVDHKIDGDGDKLLTMRMTEPVRVTWPPVTSIVVEVEVTVSMLAVDTPNFSFAVIKPDADIVVPHTAVMQVCSNWSTANSDKDEDIADISTSQGEEDESYHPKPGAIGTQMRFCLNPFGRT